MINAQLLVFLHTAAIHDVQITASIEERIRNKALTDIRAMGKAGDMGWHFRCWTRLIAENEFGNADWVSLVKVSRSLIHK